MYTGQPSLSILPVVGAVWTPSDLWRLELLFPRARVIRRLEDGLVVYGVFGLQEPFDNLDDKPQWQDTPPEPYCDANGNGRWDGIYQDNGLGPATGVHDPLEVRAFAISYRHDTPEVHPSLDQVRLIDYYSAQACLHFYHIFQLDAYFVVFFSQARAPVESRRGFVASGLHPQLLVEEILGFAIPSQVLREARRFPVR